MFLHHYSCQQLHRPSASPPPSSPSCSLKREGEKWSSCNRWKLIIACFKVTSSIKLDRICQIITKKNLKYHLRFSRDSVVNPRIHVMGFFFSFFPLSYHYLYLEDAKGCLKIPFEFPEETWQRVKLHDDVCGRGPKKKTARSIRYANG